MSETAAETTEVPEGGTTEVPAGNGAAETSTWSPSQDEWGAVVGGMKFLADQGFFAPENYEEEEEEAPDLEKMDMAQLMQRYVDGRIGEVQPYVEAAAREAGEKRLGELLDEFEVRPEVGKLDKGTRHAVGFVAESMLSRIDPKGKDPQAAVYAVYEAAKMLGGLTKTQREEAVKDFKDSFKRNPYSDPDVSGGGERSITPAKSYEEVIDRWAGQEEV